MSTPSIKSKQPLTLNIASAARSVDSRSAPTSMSASTEKEAGGFEAVMARHLGQAKKKSAPSEASMPVSEFEKKSSLNRVEASTDQALLPSQSKVPPADGANPPALQSTVTEVPGPAQMEMRRNLEPIEGRHLREENLSDETPRSNLAMSSLGGIQTQASSSPMRNLHQEFGRPSLRGRAETLRDRVANNGGDPEIDTVGRPVTDRECDQVGDQERELTQKGDRERPSIQTSPEGVQPNAKQQEHAVSFIPVDSGAASGLNAAQAAQHLSPVQREVSIVTTPIEVHAHISDATDAAGFSQAFASQVSIITFEGISRAELSLNPPNMGPVQIDIRHINNTVEVDFKAANAQTCEAIQASLGLLRDLLSEQGMVLQDSTVQSMVLATIPEPNETRNSGHTSSEPGQERQGAMDQQLSNSAGGRQEAKQGRSHDDKNNHVYSQVVGSIALNLIEADSSPVTPNSSSRLSRSLSVFA
jgi:hypothetical protein